MDEAQLSATAIIDDLKSQIKELKRRQEEANGLKKELATANVNMIKSQRLESRHEIMGLESVVSKYKSKDTFNRNQQRILDEQIQELKSNYDRLKSASRTEKTQLEVARDLLQQRINRCTSELNDCNDKTYDLDNKLAELTTKLSEAPLLEDVKRLQEEITECEQKLNHAERDLRLCQSENRRLNFANEKFAAEKEQQDALLAGANDTINTLRSELHGLHETQDRLKSEKEALNTDIEHLSTLLEQGIADQDILKEELRTKTRDLAEVEQTLSDVHDQYNEQLQTLNRALNSANATLSTAQARISTLESQNETLRRDFDQTSDNLADTMSKLDQRTSELKDCNDLLEDGTARLRAAERIAQGYVQRLEILHDELNACKASLQQSRHEENASLHKTIANIRQEMRQVRQDCARAEEELRKTRAEVRSKDRLAAAYRQDMESQVSDLKSQVEDCRSRLSRTQSENTDISLLVQRMESELASGQTTIVELRQRMVDSDEQLEERTATINELQVRLRALQEELTSVLDESSNNDERIEQLQSRNSVLENDLASRNNEIASLQDSLQAVQSEKSAIQLKYDECQGKCADLVRELEIIKIQLAESFEGKEKLQNELNDLQLAHDNYVSAISEWTSRSNGKSASEVFEQLEKTQKENANFATKQAELQSEIRMLTEHCQTLEGDMNRRMNEINDAKTKCLEDLRDCQSRLRDWSLTYNSVYEQFQGAISAKRQLEVELTSLQHVKSELLTRGSLLQQEIAGLKEVNIECESEVERLRREVAASATSILNMTERNETILASLSEKIDNLIQAESAAEDCEKRLHECNEREELAKANEEAARRDLVQMAETANAYNAQAKQCEEQLALQASTAQAEKLEREAVFAGEREAAEEQLNNVTARNTRCAEELRFAHERAARMARESAELRTQMERDAANRLHDFEARLAEQEADLKTKLSQAFDQAAQIARQRDDARVTAVELQKDLDEAVRNQSELQKQLSDSTGRVNRLEGQRKECETAHAQTSQRLVDALSDLEGTGGDGDNLAHINDLAADVAELTERHDEALARVSQAEAEQIRLTEQLRLVEKLHLLAETPPPRTARSTRNIRPTDLIYPLLQRSSRRYPPGTEKFRVLKM